MEIIFIRNIEKNGGKYVIAGIVTEARLVSCRFLVVLRQIDPEGTVTIKQFVIVVRHASLPFLLVFPICAPPGLGSGSAIDCHLGARPVASHFFKD